MNSKRIIKMVCGNSQRLSNFSTTTNGVVPKKTFEKRPFKSTPFHNFEIERNDKSIKKVSVNTFTPENAMPRILVNIREFYTSPDGKELPGAKGIALNREQWDRLKANIDNIEAAIVWEEESMATKAAGDFSDGPTVL